ncbi:MAG TPA: NADH-quinone oxidoreductase subunit I [Candidatus Aquicultor sp.]|jgi:NADH-quinone oxidoreductase subunit I
MATNMAGQLKKFYEAWKSIVAGHSITMKKAIARNNEVTLLYPYEKPELAERFRGAPMVNRYLGETDTKEGTCIACGICAKTCPVNCITVEKEKDKEAVLKVANWQLDLTKCMFCGLCSESCPTGALRMSHDYENSEYKKERLVYGMEQVLRRPITLRQSAAPAEE